jgi:hypothetical protein
MFTESKKEEGGGERKEVNLCFSEESVFVSYENLSLVARQRVVGKVIRSL